MSADKTRALVYDVICVNCENNFGFTDTRGMFFVCTKCGLDIKENKKIYLSSKIRINYY